MRLSMQLVVVMIVILIVALVVLLVFNRSLINILPATDARANCLQIGGTSCKSMGQLPSTWNEHKVNYNNRLLTCKQITGISDCSGFS